MYYRNTLPPAALSTALFLVLSLAAFPCATGYAQTQTSLPLQKIQLPQTTVASTQIRVMTPHVVRQGTASLIDHYNSDKKLRLVLNLQPPHLAEEDQFVKDLVTKGSSGFHRFLTQDEWNARFAPSAQDEQAVVDWAQSVGLTVTKRYGNRLLVDVEGRADTIEKAFGVTINNYRVGEEVDFSNDRDPVLPAHLTGILSGVVGLNNIERVRRIGSSHVTKKGEDYVPGPAISETGILHGAGDPTRNPAGKSVAAKASGSRSTAKPQAASATGFSAQDSYPLDYMSGRYGMDPSSVQSSEAYDYSGLQRFSACCNQPGLSGGSPPESSIALVGFGGFNASDVVTFFNNYGMAYLVTTYCIDGSTCPSSDDEAPLDVEYATAMSNSYGSEYDTAHVYEYEMTNNLWSTYEDAYNDVLNDGHAKVVSTSYGGNEDPNSTSAGIETGTMHSIFNNMVAAGITLIAASGDQGSAVGCGAATAVGYPSSDPDVIAAGGTQLNLNYDGTFLSEQAWQGEFWSGACGSNHGGSSGGRSVLFSAPYWQGLTNSTYPNGVETPYYEWQTVNGTTTEYEVSNNSNRLVPDISLTANPDVLGQWYYYGGWISSGGTSIVAPELAGFFAQENSYLDKIGSICGSGSTACSPVGLASPFFYEDAISGAPHNPFYDMTAGCSNNDITVADNLVYYCAYSGYDPITGWGSANMMQLAWGINWELIPAYGTPSLSFGGPATNTWFNSDQIVDWTLSDAGTSGYPAPGALGFTLGWDSIPSDSYSEPHGGAGDSFYNGPQDLSTFGCVDNNGTYCEAASGQGCHTVYVEGWDNQGRTTYGSYGPVCYDSVAPTISASTNPATSYSTYVDRSVAVTLYPSDPGGSNASGIATTYYAINTGSCSPSSLSSCSVYNGPLTISAQGQTYIYYFTKDNAGNYSSEPYIYVSIDTTVPVTTASLSGTIKSGSTYQSAVKVTLSATAGPSGVQHIYYQLDGGTQTTYTSPITVSSLGSHTIKYWAVSNSGETESPVSSSFSIVSPTISTLTASPSPALLGTSVTLKATITASVSGTPTGTATFYNGSTSLGTATLSNGVAIYSTSSLPAGALSLHATYPGAGNFLSSTSPSITEDITQNTTTTLTSSLNPSNYGQSVTFTAKVMPSNSGIPTGTVTFKNGSSSLGTGTLDSSGIATLAVTTLPAGSDSITADYGGSSTFNASNSSSLTETVNSAPAVTFSPTSLTFPSTSVGSTSAAQTVYIRNTGKATLDFSSETITGSNSSSFIIFSNACGSPLAPNSTCAVQIEFKPTLAGNLTGALSVADNASGSPQTLPLAGTGASAAPMPAVTFSPTSLTFPSTSVGSTSAAQTVYIRNTGKATLDFSSETITGPNSSSFIIFSNACGSPLAPNSTCAVQIEFKPTLAGNLTGALSVADNASGSPQTLPLAGTGASAAPMPAVTFSPTSLTFPSTSVGSTSAAQTVYIRNTGKATLDFSSETITGPNSSSFIIFSNACGSPLAPNSTCAVQIEFKPTLAGNLTGALSVADNAPGSPQTLPLTGTGASAAPMPAVTFSPTSLTFPSTSVGSTSAAQTVYIRNTGKATLDFSSETITGPNSSSFIIFSNACGSPLAPNSTCAVQIKFKPTLAGNLTGALSVADNASGSPQTLPLTGTGASSGASSPKSIDDATSTFPVLSPSIH